MTHEEPDRPSQAFDPFEQELRRFLTDEAAEPAPEQLVARIAAIPGTTRPGVVRASEARGWLSASLAALSAHRFSPTLTAVAALAVVIVAGSLLLRGFAPTSDLGSSRSSGPFGGSPSAGALGPSPTAASSVIPSPSLAPSSLGPVGGPIPTDFHAASATFTSADEGWLLGSATCAGSPCAAIVRTTDGGRTWASIPAPDSAFVPGGSGTTGVSGLWFADALDGWAFGPNLWATHDGGATWRRVSLPGPATDLQIMTLAAAAGVVHAVYFDGNAGGLLMIATSPVDSDAWVVSPTTVELGAGPVPHPQLVLYGTAGWLVEVDRVVVAGARLVSGAWASWQPPCATVAGPAILAATSSSDLVVACDVGLWSTPTGEHLFVSSDAGVTFTEATSKVPVTNIDGVGAPAPGTVLLAGGLSDGGSAIVGSFDSGTTWAPVHTLQATGSVDLSFMTTRIGFAVASSGDGTSELLMTGDGGRTWSKVPITGG